MFAIDNIVRIAINLAVSIISPSIKLIVIFALFIIIHLDVALHFQSEDSVAQDLFRTRSRVGLLDVASHSFSIDSSKYYTDTFCNKN